MPTYELAILLRSMPKEEIVSVLKRATTSIFDKGGIIRKIENLGFLDTPYKIKNHGMVHKQANYFVVQFDSPPTSLADLAEEYDRDVDVIRKRFYKVEPPKFVECTIADEMKPAPYRLEVQKMIEEGKSKKERKFKYNSGLNYYPFQK
ncbi:hypothetical protein J437_LFUL002078 [Ladona fulva]|uniref:Small ribosomal subunit protein bS6m n=1 Tax=Ladona fulva TaxID=123851 RepID=A0A8K0NXF1_LADFU|nr:hypothetical protein J437_LFUL002078 [Ladona fulva]